MSRAIEVHDLAKRYRIGERARQNRSLRETITDAAIAPFRNLRRLRRLTSFDEDREGGTIWALRGVGFELDRGEVLGIIGRNGAGKSTLLKILARITEPTRGRAIVYGQVGSLLEVGTGFHPELTGRDNVYLNGAILGMDRAFIGRHFDEIVDFSGVATFIDTPVKRYSSGMRVRLAFAVAAHLQPEVLIIDEVLSVGDAEFQKKCLGKMDTIARSGRTILFVSHNMTAVQNLCDRCIWIDDGLIRAEGETSDTIHAYLSQFETWSHEGQMDLRAWPQRIGAGPIRIVAARILDEEGGLTTVVRRGRPMIVEWDVEGEGVDRLHLSTEIVSEAGDKVLHMAHHDTPGLVPGVLSGPHTVRVRIPSLPLNCGNFGLRLSIYTEHLERAVDVVENVLPFSVEESPDSPRPYRTPAEWGFCWTPSQWELIDRGAEGRPSMAALSAGSPRPDPK